MSHLSKNFVSVFSSKTDLERSSCYDQLFNATQPFGINLNEPICDWVEFIINNVTSGSAEKSRFSNHRHFLYEVGIWRCSQYFKMGSKYFQTVGQALFLEQLKSSLDALMWASAQFPNLVTVFTDKSFTALVNHTYHFVCLIYSKLHQWIASILLMYIPVVLSNSLFW